MRMRRVRPIPASAAFAFLVWALSGPLFAFSDTWQLVVNTGTTVLTFLIVFLIQNVQNREAKAIHLKLDELIRAVEKAENRVMDAEEQDEDTIDQLKKEVDELGRVSRSTRP